MKTAWARPAAARRSYSQPTILVICSRLLTTLPNRLTPELSRAARRRRHGCQNGLPATGARRHECYSRGDPLANSTRVARRRVDPRIGCDSSHRLFVPPKRCAEAHLRKCGRGNDPRPVKHHAAAPSSGTNRLFSSYCRPQTIAAMPRSVACGLAPLASHRAMN
jgi:hypothetical protein